MSKVIVPELAISEPIQAPLAFMPRLKFLSSLANVRRARRASSSAFLVSSGISTPVRWSVLVPHWVECVSALLVAPNFQP